EFLDSFCKIKNSEFSADQNAHMHSARLLKEMNLAIDAGLSEFGERNFCRKFTEGTYETRFNRAVFDVLVGSLSREDIRDWATKNPTKLKSLYEHVSTNHPEFVKSVESTTKSPEATRTRFSVWYDALYNE